jgi:phenylacetate-coenzyme A ligase PaaK-like adenylate-forming protein
MTGEPLTDDLRADLRARSASLGASKVFLQGRLGLTEMQGALIECREGSGMHNPAPDQFLVEIVDQDTGKRRPGHLTPRPAWHGVVAVPNR